MNGKNITIQDGMTFKRVGYKSLRGFIRILKQQNNKLKKLGCIVEFSIKLPIKD